MIHDDRNVPGIAVYFFGLAQLRTSMSSLTIFNQPPPPPLQPLPTTVQDHPDTLLPTLSPTGDFLAGVVARTSVGFVLMPITVVKTRFEVKTPQPNHRAKKKKKKKKRKDTSSRNGEN
jgi:solute carrier family 25 protein 38